MINEQARIVCETSLDRSCIVDVVIFFFRFRLSSPSVFGVAHMVIERKCSCVYVRRSQVESQSQFMRQRGLNCFWGRMKEEKEKKKQSAYGMKCHKIATLTKMKKIERTIQKLTEQMFAPATYFSCVTQC